MKKLVFLSLLSLAVVFVSKAQSSENINTRAIPAWLSEKGYWVAESNVNSPDTSIIYFYNNENVLVYKERLEGIVLNLRKNRVKMRLKSVLEQAVLAFENKKILEDNQSLLASLYK